MKRYPSYKPSGVDWLGEVPANWEVWKVSRLFKKIGSGTTPKAGNPEYYENGIIPWVNTGDLNDGYIDNCSNYITQKAFDDHSTLKIYEAGTLLVAMYGATIGKTAITKFAACTNQACCSLVRSKLIDTKFAFYWFLANKENIINLSYGGGQPNISQDVVRSLKIPISNVPEQLSIVRFLDYKTSQVDTFISNRQKQIELLKEQLHFKINDAITKGINPKIKFKTTDIKYVPEIPEHWDIRKFKSLTSILTCGVAATPEYVEESEGVAFLSAQNCRPFAMDLSKYNYIKPSLHKQLTRYKKPQKEDVLVTRVGAGIGQACIIDTDLEFSVYVSLTHIRPNQEILSEYIVYFFNTEYCYQLNHEGTVVGGGQGNLNVKNVERYRIPLPPVEEQKTIIAYLDKYRLEMDNLISKYQKQIDLMQEYRTSLISHAVTGKIDIRDWQPKTKEYKTAELPVQMAAEN